MWYIKRTPHSKSFKHFCKLKPSTFSQYQDGTKPNSERGFFNHPRSETKWPNCVEGKYDPESLYLISCKL